MEELVAEVQVEFFGIPRARAGLAQTPASGESLGELVEFLSRKFPALGECCFEGKCFRPGYVANLSGDRFTTNPATPIRHGDTVLILSLDAGG
ncbi:MAG: MoaD/ThiS family protein [Planctomycetaceae bacterium]